MGTNGCSMVVKIVTRKPVVQLYDHETVLLLQGAGRSPGSHREQSAGGDDRSRGCSARSKRASLRVGANPTMSWPLHGDFGFARNLFRRTATAAIPSSPAVITYASLCAKFKVQPIHSWRFGTRMRASSGLT